MGNYAIAGVRNYVIENPSDLGNFMIPDRFARCAEAARQAARTPLRCTRYEATPEAASPSAATARIETTIRDLTERVRRGPVRTAGPRRQGARNWVIVHAPRQASRASTGISIGASSAGTQGDEGGTQVDDSLSAAVRDGEDLQRSASRARCSGGDLAAPGQPPLWRD